MIPATLKRLITSSVLYMIIAVPGAVLAVLENRPSDSSGVSTGLPVRQDFLYGNGTAMSPALYMLAAQAIFTILAPRRVRWGHLVSAALLSPDCSLVSGCWLSRSSSKV
jgi:hypothetical protein